MTRWATLRAVPSRRLWLLLLAAFLLFSIPGFYSDIMSRGTYPYPIALVITAFTGMNAAVWIIAVARLPSVFVLLLIILQFFLGRILSFVGTWMGNTFNLQLVPSEQGIHFAATCMLIAS